MLMNLTIFPICKYRKIIYPSKYFSNAHSCRICLHKPLKIEKQAGIFFIFLKQSKKYIYLAARF